MASISKRTVGGKPRYDVNYREPDGRKRRKTFTRKIDADNFAATVEADKLRGLYFDPNLGKITFKAYAEEWFKGQSFEATTREGTESRLRLHIYPYLGRKTLAGITADTIKHWLADLKKTGLSEKYRSVIYGTVSSILAAAVDSGRIAKNPCSTTSVRKRAPKARPSEIVVWEADQVAAVREALPERWRIALDLGVGLGLRQGEIFGFSPADAIFLRGEVVVSRQAKVLAGNRQVFGGPKGDDTFGDKTRTVPLSDTLKDLINAHMAACPPRSVALPWRELDGQVVTADLLLTTREKKAVNKNYFNSHIWKPALIRAGVEPTRANGMHALRHHFASTLLDAGESIVAVSKYLGHADPGFTLRTYTHVMRSSDSRTRQAVDDAFARYITATSGLSIPAHTA
jgi:integrase